MAEGIAHFAGRVRELGRCLNAGEAAIKAVFEDDVAKLPAPLNCQRSVAEVASAFRRLADTLALVEADALADAGLLDAGFAALAGNGAIVVRADDCAMIVARADLEPDTLVGRA